MKIAIFGNNLNQGYFFTRLFHQCGYEARLLLPHYPDRQEHHDWWSGTPMDPQLVLRLDGGPFSIGGIRPLSTQPVIRKLYDTARAFDLLFLTENGPAVFSEFHERKKIFRAFGWDIQVMPFLLKHLHGGWPGLWSGSPDPSSQQPNPMGQTWKATIKFFLKDMMLQYRQRKGLGQCQAVICDPHNQTNVQALDLAPSAVHYFPFPMETEHMQREDPNLVEKLKDKYSNWDTVFFHPTRQFYLPLDRNPYLKGNDVLIKGYALFKKRSSQKTLLLLVEKGRSEDIRATHALIKELDLHEHVRWIPEIANTELRAYYRLDNLVVCDQFSPHLPVLGNIGREAMFFGRALITSFSSINELVYPTSIRPNPPKMSLAVW